MTIEVYRGGVNAKCRTLETRTVTFNASKRTLRPASPSLRLTVTMTSKGGGDAFVDIRLHFDHYSQIAAAMIDASPNEATKAFGAAMKDGFPSPNR